ncbi:MAG: DUF3617 family protein [Xanthobacteraceae bacterium]
MSMTCQRSAVGFGVVAALAVQVLIAHADGIDPGLWKTVTTTKTSDETGPVGPPKESSKCLTADQTRDLATTFSPIARTVNSNCDPIERTLTGTRLNWRLTCKGQLDMELTGEFNFDSPHHYTGTMRSNAKIPGVPMTIDSESTIEGQWISACPQ